ncbi:hypothetical protein B0H17DRAFT_1128173 [Mycena rosella]|uniref:Protein kinase domain-containing protein n=1 Tax=Mycena rosella TaxID=1033263 RepID=A0AAD7GQQ7_MYCRO|nr:hypothetical protein B0H17DRAFT_1128173 [Mycena rosella]
MRLLLDHSANFEAPVLSTSTSNSSSVILPVNESNVQVQEHGKLVLQDISSKIQVWGQVYTCLKMLSKCEPSGVKSDRAVLLTSHLRHYSPRTCRVPALALMMTKGQQSRHFSALRPAPEAYPEGPESAHLRPDEEIQQEASLLMRGALTAEPRFIFRASNYRAFFFCKLQRVHILHSPSSPAFSAPHHRVKKLNRGFFFGTHANLPDLAAAACKSAAASLSLLHTLASRLVITPNGMLSLWISDLCNLQHLINLADPDTLQHHLDTCFAQLATSVELELWQEAFPVDGHRLDRGIDYRLLHGAEISFGAPVAVTDHDSLYDYRYHLHAVSAQPQLKFDEIYARGTHLDSGGSVDVNYVPQLQSTLTEITALENIQHPHLIKMFASHHAAYKSTIYLVLEYMPDNIFSYIKQELDTGALRKGKPEKGVHEIMYQLCHAMSHIHVGNHAPQFEARDLEGPQPPAVDDGTTISLSPLRFYSTRSSLFAPIWPPRLSILERPDMTIMRTVSAPGNVFSQSSMYSKISNVFGTTSSIEHSQINEALSFYRAATSCYAVATRCYELLCRSYAALPAATLLYDFYATPTSHYPVSTRFYYGPTGSYGSSTSSYELLRRNPNLTI